MKFASFITAMTFLLKTSADSFMALLGGRARQPQSEFFKDRTPIWMCTKKRRDFWAKLSSEFADAHIDFLSVGKKVIEQTRKAVLHDK